jgi:integrase
MARQVRDSRLESREARARLKPRKKAYYRLLVEGRHLGYYKGPQGGKWLARIYKGDGKYLEATLGKADDNVDADGQDVLTYSQAHALALAYGANKSQGPYSVADACRDYLTWFEAHRKSVKATWYVLDTHILPALGKVELAKLSVSDISKWHSGLAKAPARLRTGKLSSRLNTRQTSDPRARQATANRILTVLKAALNHAYHHGKTTTDEAWRKVKPFRGVDVPKIRHLSVEECARLLNACDPDFRPLVKAALLTGCRYGELVRMQVQNYIVDAGVVLVRETKSSKSRHVPLTDEGRAEFDRWTAGKLGGDLIFTREDGRGWGVSHQSRRMQEASMRAKITPAASFHDLRNTYGSLLAMQGVPLQVIAASLGHADTRMTERHYAHLRDSYVAQTIRANLPSFSEPSKTVRKIR